MDGGSTLWRIAALIAIFTTFQAEVQAVEADQPSFEDADPGELRDDIFDINRDLTHLFEGDIAIDPSRNAILNETMRWKFPIPYILTDSLELNAKGVIHQAFEAYRLKSCVDFKPYEGESTYISFTKLSGCWSFVGDFKTGQNLSIGARCDTKAIVEHELLHALGFYHEQSRSDRDDYVIIHWDQIQEGMEHNFNKYEDGFITDLNTPYNYESIMHYRPFSFNKNASLPTITTAIPYFNEIIGQRLDFSPLDITRLNRMYDCADTITLLDQCSFEQINICGMIQNEADNADWVQTLSTPAEIDHTLAGRCKDAGYFMKFDTSSGNVGKSGLLESRILYPKRGEQCLQFFYRMTGEGDKLVIWIRTDDGSGTVRSVRKIHTITGDLDDSWKIAHVDLKVTEKFRYFFQAIRGPADSTGSTASILIDDITLTETVCPNAAWQIGNFTGLLATTPTGNKSSSGCSFYNSEGYAFGISVYPNGRDAENSDYVGVTFHLCSGPDDAVLEWPVKNRQATITAMDQDPDARQRMSATRSFTTDASARWNKPTPASGAEWDEQCQCFRGQEYGWGTFITHTQLQRRSFLKGDDLIIIADFNDLTHLVKTEVPVVPAAQRDDIREVQPIRVAGAQRDDSVESMPAMENDDITEVQPIRKEEEEKDAVPKRRDVRSATTNPCLPNPCLNGGVCVDRQGKASCRCASGQATYYAGERCQTQHMDGTVLGVMIGGASGTVILTLAILSVIRRPQ